MQITPTPYFLSLNQKVYRAAAVQLPQRYSGSADVRILTGDEHFSTQREFRDGQALVPASTRYDTALSVQIQVATPQGVWTETALLAPTRQWTIYITQDKHLDYGWIHPVEQVVERINNLTDFSMDHPMRWTFENSIWIEEYLKARPSARGDLLLSRLRDGTYETAANWLVPEPGILSIEETASLLQYARDLQAQGVPIQTTLMQEAPSLSWGLATLLAEARLPYLIKGAYNLRNPHLHEREPYPLFFWEGPDGSRLLLRWDLTQETERWGGYGEAYLLWRKNTRVDQMAYIEQTITRYQGYEHYPWNAVLLVGTGFDEYPQTTAVTDFINWYNEQEWVYPRLVDATWRDYWQDLESQLDRQTLPVLRGDWGTAWEEWPAQLARLSTLYRRARPVVLSGQTLSELATRLDLAAQPGRSRSLTEAWRGLVQFADHNFGGISPDYAEDEYETKAGYAHLAMREGKRALESSIATLAAQLPRQEGGRTLVVANPNNWQRGGIVEVVLQDPGGYEVIDLVSGESLPCQLETRGPGWMQHYLAFEARDLQGFGYRSYWIRPSQTGSTLGAAAESISEYENAHYQLALDPQTGGLRSLVERETGRELVAGGDGENTYALNEYLHHSDGKLHRSELVSISLRKGALCDHWISETTNLRSTLRTTYKLYHNTPRLEIVNELYKEPSSELQASWFALPVNLAGQHQFYYDGAAAILKPGLKALGGDLLPGSGLSSVAAQSFLAVEDQAGTVVLATPDAYLFQFGKQVLLDPTGDSDPRQPLALSLAMHNFTRNDHTVRQGGQEYFTFRYRLSSTSAPFRASQAVRFATETAQDLPRAWATGGKDAALNAGGSFLKVTSEHLIATALKTAHDGHGWVLRLWECDGAKREAVLDLAGLGAKHAYACDLLEGYLSPIPVENGQARLSIPAFGVKTFRFE